MSKDKDTTKEQNKGTGRNRVFTIIGIVLCVILVPILVVNVTMIVKSYTNPDEYPAFAGHTLMIVMSPSMEPAVMNGDLIMVKISDPDEIHGESSEGAADGDIISFFDPDSTKNLVITHRCVQVNRDSDGNIVSFMTKGDANNTEDPTLVPASNLIGICIHRYAKLGDVAMWLQTTPGLIVCVAVPIILLVGYDLLMKRRYDKAKKKDTDALLAELAALRAQQAEKEAGSSDSDDAE